MDVILLFDQYLLVKQQNDIHFIWLNYGIHTTLSHGTILLLQPELAHANEINHNIHLANTLF